jgi:hypothetical protein
VSASPLPHVDGLDPAEHARTDRLVDVVRIALGIPPARAATPLDDAFVRWATRHGVRAELAATAEVVGIDDDARTTLDGLLHRDQLRALTAATIARRLVTRLDGAGVDALVLKGVALSVQRGGAPTDRPGSDLDLLVGPTDRLRAHAVLVDCGFSVHPTSPVPGDDGRTRFVGFTAYETLYVSSVLHVDLHWRLGPVHIAPLAAEEVLARRCDVRVGSVVLPTLHPDDALAHLMLHGAKDRWITLRAVVDIALVLEHAGASWPTAVARLPRSHAPATALAAVDRLTAGRLPGPSAGAPTDDALGRWVRAVVERPRPDDDHRPAEGFVGFVRHRIGLGRSIGSAVAVSAHLILPSTALARSTLPVRWWWLTAFVRPFRIVGQLTAIGLRRRTSRRRDD